MKRVLVIPLALALLAVTAPAASAVSAQISPTSQSRAHGQTAQWTLSWGHTGPYNVQFKYGDGGQRNWTNTSLTGSNASRVFMPCSNTVYTQTLKVTDSYGTAETQSTTTVTGGSPC
jgi:hypothetical protein